MRSIPLPTHCSFQETNTPKQINGTDGTEKNFDMNANGLQPHMQKENKLPNFENNHYWFCLYEVYLFNRATN